MAMTAEGMLASIKAARGAVSQTSDPAAAAAMADQAMLAMCSGIIDYIKAHAELEPITTDATGGIVTGRIK